MSFRKMLVLPVALLLAASSLSAFQSKPLESTGVWTGTFRPSTGEQGEFLVDLEAEGSGRHRDRRARPGSASADCQRQSHDREGCAERDVRRHPA